ncbi:acyltransferase [uncultured Flavobacterium sp.]|uniref:acyltransferase family protein n=1 Tax=uncultured Flavobacterium sp. TaxID=165435 RepID=UPI0025E8DEFF|nr:acyltransferase [uncultured Flavobacterium sp.]
MSRKKFHTFDFFRFFAFFKVFLLHLPIVAFPFFNFVKAGGEIGVYFFFVLSGFLITYIILYEKKETGTLNFRNFISRRILRIWPLFYAMILFAFLTPKILSLLNFPNSTEGYAPNWLVSIFFLENYKMIFSGNFPNTSPLRVMWSLCVEEHFYLIWGTALYFTKLKNVKFLIIGAIIIASISRIIFYQNDLAFLDVFTNLDYFAFGAIPALLLVQKENAIINFINAISLSYKFVFLFLALAYVIISPNFNFPFKILIEPILFGILFSSLLFIILPENSKIKISDRNIFSRLGIYTYGLYLTHTIVINLFVRIFEKLKLPIDEIWNAILFGILTLAFTIIASIISYKWIEKPFLRLKKYFK